MTLLQTKTLIIGSSACAKQIAEELLKKDVDVIVAVRDQIPALSFPGSSERTGLEILTQARLLKCQGAVGDFTVSMNQQGEPIERQVSHIVVAEGDRRESNLSAYGLKPSSHVLTLSQLMGLLNASHLMVLFPMEKRLYSCQGFQVRATRSLQKR